MSRASVVRRFAAFALVPIALAASVLVTAPAAAAPPADPVPFPTDPGPSTEATIVDMLYTSALFGGEVPSATATTPYPSSGLQNQRDVTTAQIVLDAPELGPGEQMVTYCIDLETDTTIGVHYELGEWSEANVPNLPYVQWILDNYYPDNPAQPSTGSTAEKVRAVQGAIWYFTDQFVVSRFYPAERTAVRTIVEAAQAAVQNPTPTPPPLPTLTVELDADVPLVPGELYGAYAVGGSVTSSTIALNPGTEAYADEAGTLPVADGDAVPNGARLYLRYDPGVADQGFTLTAFGTVPAGNVFLYDGGNPPLQTAQKLILASDAPVPVRASAAIVPPESGTLRVNAVLAGDAAGDQSRIDLDVTCVDGTWELQRTFSIPARTPAGEFVLAELPNLVVGAECTIEQTDDGANAYATLTSSTIEPASVVIASDEVAEMTLTNVYAIPTPPTGSLAVDVTIAGDAAGAQSALDLTASCTIEGETIARDIPVAAGLTGTTTVATVTDLPVGAECDVVQTNDGRNADALITGTTILPASVSIVDAETSTITVTNTYAAPVPVVGTLQVDVTIAGTRAGAQSALALTATCVVGEAVVTRDITVPAAVTGTSTVATIPDLVPGTECSVTQSENGANATTVVTSTSIEPPVATIAAGQTSTIVVTNTYAAPAPRPTPPPSPTPAPTPGGLAGTGPEVAGAWVLALGLLALGGAAVLLEVRRRRSVTTRR
ncbi:thioester domain-containing protein [Agromyces atrinae]|uniref:thioester domain-containing protein n=1 Tax=Agromyces atrinae TaxID=592376 RepID=UPI00100EC275|nr:thioester domain-containing protein [Agromyces atrinae]